MASASEAVFRDFLRIRLDRYQATRIEVHHPDFHRMGRAKEENLVDDAELPAHIPGALLHQSVGNDLTKHGERVSTRAGRYYSLALAQPKVAQPKLVQLKPYSHGALPTN